MVPFSPPIESQQPSYFYRSFLRLIVHTLWHFSPFNSHLRSFCSITPPPPLYHFLSLSLSSFIARPCFSPRNVAFNRGCTSLSPCYSTNVYVYSYIVTTLSLESTSSALRCDARIPCPQTERLERVRCRCSLLSLRRGMILGGLSRWGRAKRVKIGRGGGGGGGGDAHIWDSTR